MTDSVCLCVRQSRRSRPHRRRSGRRDGRVFGRVGKGLRYQKVESGAPQAARMRERGLRSLSTRGWVPNRSIPGPLAPPWAHASRLALSRYWFGVHARLPPVAQSHRLARDCTAPFSALSSHALASQSDSSGYVGGVLVAPAGAAQLTATRVYPQ